MGWYEALKDAVTVAQKADNIELIKRLLDAQRELLDMQEENLRLRTMIQQLEQSRADTDGLYFNKHAYWRKRDGVEDGPFCPRCFDADKKLIRLRRPKGYLAECPQCRNPFDVDGTARGPVIA